MSLAYYKIGTDYNAGHQYVMYDTQNNKGLCPLYFRLFVSLNTFHDNIFLKCYWQDPFKSTALCNNIENTSNFWFLQSVHFAMQC